MTLSEFLPDTAGMKSPITKSNYYTNVRSRKDDDKSSLCGGLACITNSHG